MKTKLLGVLTFLTLLFSFACEKDKICIENTICSSNEYMPLAIGNYWVYELQNFNLTTYAITTSPRPDTIEVIGDTIIRNRHYFTVRSKGGEPFKYLEYISFLRDSTGYLVNDSGEILFASDDFDKPLNRTDIPPGPDGERFIEYAIRDTTYVRIAPAGVFNCLDYRGQAWTGLEWDNNIIYHNYLAKNVGIVYQSNLFTLGVIESPLESPPTHERRRLLKEYFIND